MLSSSKSLAEFQKDTHCSYCGEKFSEQKRWPRTCGNCENESYKNPIPIIVSLIPVQEDSDRIGLLIQQRGIEPKKNEWALPGGYIEFGESWQQAAVRENEEEMRVYSRPEHYELWDVKMADSGNILIFCKYNKIWTDQVKRFIDRFRPNQEVMKLGIYYGESGLAFPTHKECADICLSRMNADSAALWT